MSSYAATDLSNSSYRTLADGSALARSQPARQADALSLRDYCVGDGTTDDTVGVKAWLADMVSANRAGWVPQGRYRLTSQLPTITTPVSIYGEGYTHSEILFDNCNGLVFDISGISQVGTIVLVDIALVTNKQNIYQGLTVTGCNQKTTTGTAGANAAFIARDLHVERVAFRGPDQSATSGWYIDLELIGVGESQVDNCMFVGSNQSYYKSGVTGDGTVNSATRGVYIHGGSNNIQMINPHFYWKGVCHHTVKLSGEVGSEPGAIYGVQVQASLYGFVMTGGAGAGGPFVSGGSMNVVLRGVVYGAPSPSQGADFAAVWDVQFLRNFGNGTLPFTVGSWFAVECYSGHAWCHNNNVFLPSGTASVTQAGTTSNVSYQSNSCGIFLGSGAVDVSLTANKIQGANTGIFFSGSATGSTLEANTYDAFSNANGTFINADSVAAFAAQNIGMNPAVSSSGARTMYSGTQYARPACEAILTSNVSNVTGDGSPYTVAFDTATSDGAGLLVPGGGGVFQIPLSGWYDIDADLRLTGVAGQVTAAVQLARTQNGGSPYVLRVKEFNAQYELSPGFDGCVYLQKGDSVRVNLVVAGGSKGVGLLGSSGGTATRISLVCVRVD